MKRPVSAAGDAISFGPFRLVASERLLTRDGAPVELGARTLDTLIALVSRPNEVVSKKELLARVWPDVTVEEGSLRFHIAGLRKALGDGKDGARYIATLAGRGYCFVAAVSESGDRARGHAAIAPLATRANLPARLTRMLGRADDVLALSTQLTVSRFVTIAGPGGVGKTTAAVAVAHDLLEAFAGVALFVDLSALNEPDLVATSVASMLGLSVQAADPTLTIVAYLRDKRMMLILDSCEHVIEAAAALAERIFLGAPDVHVLATSREALRSEGEQVYKLAPLDVPPDEPGLTAAAALRFPATQLFVERAAASGARLNLSDADAVIVASICRRLDGVALAIELAAGRVEAYGLQQTAALLDQRLALLWQGQRTAPPRHKTLQATLDWSYGLLSGLERLVLRRLAVFVGQFTIEAALAVVPSATIDRGLVFGTIDSLVAKSIVATRPVGAMMRYRLLDTTRAYALEIKADDSELADVAARHATYYRTWLEQAGSEWRALSDVAERAPYLAALANVRAALEWCFGGHGDTAIGVGLAAAAAPAFLAMSLLTECHRWCERAILVLDDAARGGAEEMHLQAALGMSLMFTRGNSDAASVALNRGLAIARARGDIGNEARLLGPLHIFHMRGGDFRAALQYARRSCAVAATLEDPAAITSARTLLGNALYLIGDLDGARMELEAGLRQRPGFESTSIIHLGLEQSILACIALARTLWFQGHPAQAIERLRVAVKDAERTNHPVSLAFALQWAASILLSTDDLQDAEQHIARFLSHAESHSLGPYVVVGRGLHGSLAIRRGNAKDGVEALRACLEKLRDARYELLTTEFSISLAQGLAATGQLGEGMTLIDEAIRRVGANGDVSYMPELLRVKGSILLSMPQPRSDDAETCLIQSLELSRRHATRAWELRTALDLAELWRDQGQPERAQAVLRPVLEQFRAGSDSPDLTGAERLLASLGS